MLTKITPFIFSILLAASLNSMANSKVVSVGVANFPPYSIVEDNKISGAEVEIIKESLAVMGYETNFVVYPYGRLPNAFENKAIDSTIVTLKNFKDIEVYYSEIVLPEYQTVAIQLTEYGFQIDQIQDLSNRSVIAHQRANLFYGDEYKNISIKSKETSRYIETKRQDAQVMMLFKERTEVIVLAHEIFKYYESLLADQLVMKEYTVSKIFGDKFGFYNAFRTEQTRDDFNKGLAQIKSNGTYLKILQKYLKEHSYPESN